MGSVLTYTITGNAGGLVAAAGAAEGALNSLGGAAGRVAGTVESAFKIAAGAAVAAGTAMAAGLAVGVKGAADLQQAVANISTIKPDIDTSAVFASLNALSTKVPQSTKQLADSLYDVFSSMEVTQTQALSLVETFAKGATGAQTSAQTFGTSIMGVLNAYKLDVSEATHVSDVFFNTVNRGVVTGEELAQNLGMVTQAAKLANVDINTLGAMIAGVTKEGGPAAQNINNLNNLLVKINTKEAAKGFQELGISVFNADGTMRPVLDVLGDLKIATSGMTEEAKILAIQKIFPDMQARAGASVIMSQLDFVNTALAENRASVGSTQAAYEKMSATFQAQTKLLGNSIKAVGVTIGAAFLPMLTRLTTAANQHLQAWQPVIQAFADKIPAALEVMVAKAAPLVARFGAVAAVGLTLGRYFAETARQGDYLNDHLSELPPTLAKVAETVGRLSVALVGTLKGAFDSLRSGVGGADIFGTIAAGATALTGAFTRLAPVAVQVGHVIVDNVVTNFRFLVDRVLPPLVSIVEQTGRTFLALAPTFAQVGGVMRGILGDTLDWLAKEVWPPFLNIVTQTVGFFQQTVLPTLPAVAGALRTALGETVQWLATDVWPNLTRAAGVAWTFISGTIVPAVPAVVAAIRDVLGGAIQWVAREGWPMFTVAGTAAWTFITTKIVPAVTDLIAWLKEKLPPAIASVTTAWETLKGKLAPIIEAVFSSDIMTAIKGLGSAFAEFATLATGWLGEQVANVDWASVWSKARDVLVSAASWFADAATLIAGWIGEKVAQINWTDVWNKAVSVFEAAAMWFGDAALKIATWISDQVAAIDWASVWNKAVGVIEGMAQWFVPVVTEFTTWIGEKVAGIEWATVWAQAKDVVAGMAQWFVTVATEFTTWLGEQVAKIDWPRVWSEAKLTAQTIVDALAAVVGSMDAALTGWMQKQIESTNWRVVGDALGRMLAAPFVTGTQTAIDGIGPQLKRETITTALGNFLIGVVEGAFAMVGPAMQRAWQATIDKMTPSRPSWWPAQAPWPFGPQANGGMQFPAGPNPAGTPGSATSGNVMRYQPGSWEDKAFQYAQQAGHPDPTEFVEQMRHESNFDPGAYNQQSGATGIAQIVPRYHPGVDATDPDASLRYAANLMAQHYATYGSSDRALAAYNGGGGAVGRLDAGRPYQETQQYLQTIHGRTESARQSAPAGAAGMVTYRDQWGNEYTVSQEDWQNHPGRASGGYTVINDGSNPVGSLPGATAMSASSDFDPAGIQNFRQSQQAWSQNARDANTICGPYLASLFADAVGRPPTPEEARQLGAKMGIYHGNGIESAAGFDEYATALIQQVNPGSQVRVQQQMGVSNFQAQNIASESLAGGAPIAGFNTQNHYFGADQFDPASGKFHVGGTGLSLAGGSEWMSVDEMTAKMGPLLGVLTLVDDAAGVTVTTFKEMGDGAAAAGADGLVPLQTAAEATSLSVTDMSVATLQATTDMATGLTTTIGEAAAGTVMTMTDMSGQVVSQVATMGDGTVVSMDAMAAGTTTSVTQLADGFQTTMTDLAGNTVTTVTDMAGNVVSQAVTMGADSAAAAAQMATDVEAQAAVMAAEAILQAAGMQTGVTEATTAMAGDTSAAVEDMASGVTEQFQAMQEDITSAAEEAASGVEEAFSDIEIEPPDVSGVIKEFKKIEKAAASAKKAIDEVGSKGGDSKKGSSSSKGKKASGGGGGEGGEHGFATGGILPEDIYGYGATSGDRYRLHANELVVPAGAGGTLRDGGDLIDYDKLARAIARASKDQNYNLTINTTADHEPIRQDFEILRSLASRAT